MAKGNPNDPSMRLNFIAKVWDNDAKDYRPIYIAPDATNGTRGDVYLSDAVNGTDNAESGVTAATPAAVKAVNDNVNKKVDKSTTDDQSIASSLLPNVTNTKDLGSSSKVWRNVYATNFVGNLNGTATKATQLANARQMTIKTGKNTDKTADLSVSASFDGQSNIEWNISKIDASIVNEGMLPLSVIPQGARERLVQVANKDARLKLTIDQIQQGDVVQEQDTGLMYYVYDDTKLNTEQGYREFTAGTATSANYANKLDPGNTIRTNLGKTDAVNFNGTAAVEPGVTGTLGISNGGTGLTSNPSMLVDLSKITGDNVLKVDPRPGIVNTLGIANGGTGASTKEQAWTNLGGGSVGKLNTNGSSTQFLRGDGTWQTVSAEDVKTRQSSATANANYPLLFKNSANDTAETAGVNYVSGLTINPSTKTIVADSFKGSLDGNAATATSATSATTASKLSTTSVGGTAKPVYWANGIPTVCSANVGSATKPVFMSAGEIKASDGNVGDTNKPLYLKGGELTALSGNIGSAGTPVYINGGAITACTGGMVYVGTTQPTDAGILWWIDTSS